MNLIEDEGKVGLYQDGNWVYVEYQGKKIKLTLPTIEILNSKKLSIHYRIT